MLTRLKVRTLDSTSHSHLQSDYLARSGVKMQIGSIYIYFSSKKKRDREEIC